MKLLRSSNSNNSICKLINVLQVLVFLLVGNIIGAVVSEQQEPSNNDNSGSSSSSSSCVVDPNYCNDQIEQVQKECIVQTEQLRHELTIEHNNALEECLNKVSIAETKINALTIEVENATQTIQSIERDVVSVLLFDIENLKTKNTHLQEQYNTLLIEKKQLEKENDKQKGVMKEQYNTLVNEKKQLEKEKDKHIVQIKDMKNTIFDIRRELFTATEELRKPHIRRMKYKKRILDAYQYMVQLYNTINTNWIQPLYNTIHEYYSNTIQPHLNPFVEYCKNQLNSVWSKTSVLIEPYIGNARHTIVSYLNKNYILLENYCIQVWTDTSDVRNTMKITIIKYTSKNDTIQKMIQTIHDTLIDIVYMTCDYLSSLLIYYNVHEYIVLGILTIQEHCQEIVSVFEIIVLSVIALYLLQLLLFVYTCCMTLLFCIIRRPSNNKNDKKLTTQNNNNNNNNTTIKTKMMDNNHNNMPKNGKLSPQQQKQQKSSGKKPKQ